MNIGFAPRDKVSAVDLSPIALECRRLGHGVTVFSKGVAHKEFAAYSTRIVVEAKSKEVAYWDELVRGIHCLVVRTSNTISNDDPLAHAAKRARIPVVTVPTAVSIKQAIDIILDTTV